MNIPKYVGIVFTPDLSGEPINSRVIFGSNEINLQNETLLAYCETVDDWKEDPFTASSADKIGWDIYVSTRASANSPDAIHRPFEGPGA